MLLGMAGCQQASEAPSKPDAGQMAKAALEAALDSPEAIAQERAMATKRASLKGCAVGAISVEQDFKGLNVRAGPSKGSLVVGVLHSLIETDPHAPNDPPQPSDRAFGPAFNIIAISGPWLRIADIDATTEGYDPVVGKHAIKRNYQGSGWVHRSRVGVDPGFHDDAYDRPYNAPGRWTKVNQGAGALLTLTGGKQGETAELLTCERNWLRIRYIVDVEGGKTRSETGWFKMHPHFTGSAMCKVDDSDCQLRQSMDIWD